MAGLGASIAKNERMGYIPYAGPLKDVLVQFVSGIRSGMSYIGGFNI